MPNHLHLIAVEGSAEIALAKLRAVMSGVRRSAAGRGLLWEQAPPPPAIPDAFHLQRQLRYLALNPSRAGLVRDPLEWMWSTHRDVIGAIAEPWVRSETVARRLGKPLEGFGSWQHAYVSGDPTVSLDGTPFPTAAKSTRCAEHSLREIAAAASAATRAYEIDVRRRTPTRALFMDLARACGWRDAETVALACDTNADAVRWRARRGQIPPYAAWLCLGDVRLRDRGEHRPRIATRPRLGRHGGVISIGSRPGRDSP